MNRPLYFLSREKFPTHKGANGAMTFTNARDALDRAEKVAREQEASIYVHKVTVVASATREVTVHRLWHECYERSKGDE